MSIFTLNTKTDEYVLEAYEGHVDPSLNGALEIAQETSEQMYTLNASMYITDIMLENSALEGEDVEGVLESVVKDSLEKAKKIFINFFQKLKAWFQAAIQKVTVFFTGAEKFVEKFEKQLHEKAKEVKDFKYEGYNYDVAAGKAEGVALRNKIDAHLSEVLNFDKALQTVAGQLGNLQSGADEATKKEDHEALLKALGAESNADLSKKLIETYQGGSSKEEVKLDVAEFIKLIKAKKEHVQGLKNAEKANAAQFKLVMRAIDNARKKIRKDEKSEEQGRALALANRQLNTAHKALNLWSLMTGVEVKMVRKAASQAESVLKKLLTYKSKEETKEDAPKKEEATTESFLAMAQRYI